MSKFIGYTVGLECWVPVKSGERLISVKVEFNAVDNDLVKLNIVSGHNSSSIHQLGNIYLTQDQYDEMPSDPYDSVATAIWALSHFGISPAALGRF